MQRKIPWERINGQKDFRLTDRDFLASEDLLDEQLEAFDSDPQLQIWASKYASAVTDALAGEMTVEQASVGHTRQRRVESSVRLILSDVRRVCELPRDDPESAADIGENLRKLRTALDKTRAAVAKMGSPTRRYLAEALYEERTQGSIGFPVSVITDPIVLTHRYATDAEHMHAEIEEVLASFNVNKLKNVDQRIVDMFRSSAIIWYRTIGAWPKTHKDDFSKGSDTSAPVSPLYNLLQEIVERERPELLRVFGPKKSKIKLGEDPTKPSLGRKTFQVAVARVRDDAASRYAEHVNACIGINERRRIRRMNYQDLRFGV